MYADARLYGFEGGNVGQWEVTSQLTVKGEGLPPIKRLEVRSLADVGDVAAADQAWMLKGVTSNGRYTTRKEQQQLSAVQAPMGRAQATCGVFIPIRKTPVWWAMTQDERRAIFEDQSKHISATLKFLPAIARRLHHSRDLGEPFDFLTWFDFAPENTAAFDELLQLLRQTEEWKYVDREVEIRVTRTAG